ncbi:MAG: hypothetical protein ACI9JM_001838 [Halioglobus sp.]|jgi:hypothetical protein
MIDGYLGLASFAVVAAFLSIFFLVTALMGAQKAGSDAIAVGDTIPHFTALDEYNELFDSLSLSGHLLLVKFFRALVTLLCRRVTAMGRAQT